MSFKSSLYEIYKRRILGFYQVFVFLQVFSFSLWVVFSFLTLLFPEQNFWILMKSTYYFFQGSCLLNVSKKLSPYPRSSRFSPRLSSRIFVVMYFIFRSLIHFGLIFMKYVKFVSRLIFFFFCLWPIWLYQHHLLKRLSLFHRITLILSMISWLYSCESISGHSILFHWFVCTLPIRHCLHDCNFLESLDVR